MKPMVCADEVASQTTDMTKIGKREVVSRLVPQKVVRREIAKRRLRVCSSFGFQADAILLDAPTNKPRMQVLIFDNGGVRAQRGSTYGTL